MEGDWHAASQETFGVVDQALPAVEGRGGRKGHKRQAHGIARVYQGSHQVLPAIWEGGHGATIDHLARSFARDVQGHHQALLAMVEQQSRLKGKDNELTARHKTTKVVYSSRAGLEMVRK